MAGSDSPPSGALPGLPGVQTPRALQLVPLDQTPTPKSSSGLEFELGQYVANMLRDSDIPRPTSRTPKPAEKSHLFQDVNDTQKQAQKHGLKLPITPRNRTILQPMPMPLQDCATPMRSTRNEGAGAGTPMNVLKNPGTPMSVLKNQGTPMSVLKNRSTPMNASSTPASQRTPVVESKQSKGEPDDSDDGVVGSESVVVDQAQGSCHGDSDQVEAKTSRGKKPLENPTQEVECVPQGLLT